VSIQTGRVVARIVSQVKSEPRAELPVFSSSALSAGAAGGELLEVVRLPIRLQSGDPRFATLFHFWTHALRGFLDRRGEGDQLSGVASYAMCETLAGDCFGATLAEHLERAAGAGDRERAPRGSAVSEAYRMVDGSCRRSAVAATREEWIAWFWAHGWSPNPAHYLRLEP
jgi:hypothetical protein